MVAADADGEVDVGRHDKPVHACPFHVAQPRRADLACWGVERECDSEAASCSNCCGHAGHVCGSDEQHDVGTTAGSNGVPSRCRNHQAGSCSSQGFCWEVSANTLTTGGCQFLRVAARLAACSPPASRALAAESRS